MRDLPAGFGRGISHPLFQETMSEHPVWKTCLAALEQSLSAQPFNTWIKPLTADIQDGAAVVGAPSGFVLKFVQERYWGQIVEQLRLHLGEQAKFELKLAAKKTPTVTAPVSAPVATPASSEAAIPLPTLRGGGREQGRLDPAQRFDNFVTGKANQLAYAAALQVASAEGNSAYNPLFIYGGVGLGKTHLMQAIGNHFQATHEHARVVFVHATNYLDSFVNAVKSKKVDDFNRLFNQADLLLIDDIQFISDKPGTQQQFFHTLNTLTETRKQVVISCDTFPKEIKGMEPRLTSRFSSGLTVAVEPPDFEMRTAILLQKAELARIRLDQPIAFFIAKHVMSNVRELEGALTRITAFSQFHRRPISIELAKEALADLLLAQKKQVSIDNIQKVVADYYGIKVADLSSKKRTRVIARPRQVAMWLARELTDFSLPEIGAAFGGRDHSTVLYAHRTIVEMRSNDLTLDDSCSVLMQLLRN